MLRWWGQRTLRRTLPPRTSGVAMALLLGEGSTMTQEEWDKYIRTGVVHVLAISGWHLVVLGMFLWWCVRILRAAAPRGLDRGAVAVRICAANGWPSAGAASGAHCRGGRGRACATPPRAAGHRAGPGMAGGCDCQSVRFFLPGCQMSFISVALLTWILRRSTTADVDPLKKLIEESRPPWLRVLRRFGRVVAANYAVSIVIWFAVTPLTAARYHVVAPCGFVLGPPLTVLTSIALIAGFLQLAAAAVWEPLALPFAPLVHYCLAGCDGLVDLADACPGSYFHVGDVPDWWLWLFYLALLLVIIQPALRLRWRWAVPAGLTWLCLGLLMASARLPADELRCTFLAVGHGGCVVLETPDGRISLTTLGRWPGRSVHAARLRHFFITAAFAASTKYSCHTPTSITSMG